jgi:O-antigen ligase
MKINLDWQELVMQNNTLSLSPIPKYNSSPVKILQSSQLLGLVTFFCAVLTFYPQAPRYFVFAFLGLDVSFQFILPFVLAGLTGLLINQKNLQGFVVPLVFLLCTLGLLSITAFNTTSVVYFQAKIQKTWTILPLFYVVGLTVGKAELNKRHLLKVIFWFCFVVTILSEYIGLDVVSSYAERSTAAESEIFGYQLISRIAAIGALISTCFSIFGTTSNLTMRLLGLTCAGYMMAAVSSSGGRTGLLVFIMGLSVLLLLKWPKILVSTTIIGFVIVLTVGVSSFSIESFTALANDDRLPATFRRMFFYLQSEVDLRDRISRDLLHNIAQTLFSENPFFGVGYGNFPVAAGIGDVLGRYPHNIFWELLSETGLFGLLSFAVWLSYVFGGKAWKQLLMEENRHLIAATFVFLSVAWVTSDIVGHRELFFTFGMITTLRNNSKQRYEEKSTN